jgi:hypothetical protein
MVGIKIKPILNKIPTWARIKMGISRKNKIILRIKRKKARVINKAIQITRISAGKL